MARTDESTDRAQTLEAVCSPDGATFPTYAWPGGYDIAYVMDDGENLCGSCMSDPTNPVHFEDEDPTRDGWLCIGFDVTDAWDDGDVCAHCDRHMGPYTDGEVTT
jgi:hypothetical protein